MGMRRRRRLGSCGALLLMALLAAAVLHAEADAGVFNPRGSFVMTPTKRRSDELHHEGKVSAGLQKHVCVAWPPLPQRAARFHPRRGSMHATAKASHSRRGSCRGLFFVYVLFLFFAAHALLGALFVG